jgi:hypothetical protein
VCEGGDDVVSAGARGPVAPTAGSNARVGGTGGRLNTSEGLVLGQMACIDGSEDVVRGVSTGFGDSKAGVSGIMADADDSNSVSRGIYARVGGSNAIADGIYVRINGTNAITHDKLHHIDIFLMASGPTVPPDPHPNPIV